MLFCFLPIGLCVCLVYLMEWVLFVVILKQTLSACTWKPGRLLTEYIKHQNRTPVHNCIATPSTALCVV